MKSEKAADSVPVDWLCSPRPVPYAEAIAVMERHVDAIRCDGAQEKVWFLEHPPLYTAGTSAKLADLLDPSRFPVIATGRGGQYTYHGPGQRVVYLMLDLARRGRDVRRFVGQIEAWVIDALAELGVTGYRRDGRTGIWVARPEKGEGVEDKIAAIGIRVRRWVSFHGVSINVCPDLDHYRGINACGIADQGVTSLSDLGKHYSLADLDAVLAVSFEKHFGSMVAAKSKSAPSSPSSHFRALPL